MKEKNSGLRFLTGAFVCAMFALGVLAQSSSSPTGNSGSTSYITTGSSGGSGTVTNVTSNVPWNTWTGAGTAVLAQSTNSTAIALNTFSDLQTVSHTFAASTTNTYNGFINLATSTTTGGTILKNGSPWLYSSGSGLGNLSNVWLGVNSGNTSNTGTTPSIGIGVGAGAAMTTGSAIIIGNGCAPITTSDRGIFIGSQVGGVAAATPTGDLCVLIGAQSGANVGYFDRCFYGGYRAGYNLSATESIAIGPGSGGSTGTGPACSQSIFLGKNTGLVASGQITSSSDIVCIGDSSYSGVIHGFILGNTSSTLVGIRTASPTAALHNAGTTILGANGTVFTGAASATITYDAPSINALGTYTTNLTVTGATVNSGVELGLPAAPTSGIYYRGYVSAAGTVSIDMYNLTATPIDPASQTIRTDVTIR